MKLVIVESPKKSETIGRYLGSDFKVLASQGHIRDLSTRGKGGLGIDTENGFIPDWQITPKKKEIVANLAKTAKKAEKVYLATDPDREGEAIAYHLAEVLKLPVETTSRLRFREITKPAITQAMEEVSTIDTNLVAAQEVRRMEDRIIGFKVSGLLQKKISLKSAGRVQSSTLKLIVDRKKVIDAFIPEEYWTIEIEIELDGATYKAPLTKVDGKPFKCKSEAEAQAIVARIPETLTISSVSKTVKTVSPKLPFTTSTMQQEAYSKYGFSNSRTQSVAQKLYEGLEVNGEHVGLITYMRTDSTRISPNFYNKHAVPFIKEVFGEEYIGPFRQGKSGELAQDAHEAIRPTGTHRTPEVVATYLAPDLAKLYRLIYCRAMASVMAPKKNEVTSLILSGNGLDFSLSGTRTIFPGFSKIYGEFEEKEEKMLPEIHQGDIIPVKTKIPTQKFTKPEAPYNEASIVKAMEEKGIGRPSTYASTIDTLLKRKYITATKGVLSPTDDGIKAVEVLEKLFPDIVSSDYTALMENKLDLVEEGNKTSLEALNEFYAPFMDEYKKAQEELQREGPTLTGETCPKCGSPLVVRKNKQGRDFVGCSNYPSCRYVKPDYTGDNCPVCGAPLVYKYNAKGTRFVGCSNYPKCDYIEGREKQAADTENKPRGPKVYTEADYVKPCPKCKTGFLVKRQGAKKEFLGCTNYPKCRHIEWLDNKKKD